MKKYHDDNKFGNVFTSIAHSEKQATLENLIHLTERKKVENKLRESEEKFRAIFENSLDGIFVIDLETKRFYLCNKAMCQMLGYSQEEVRNLNVTDIHANKDMPYIVRSVERDSLAEYTFGNIPKKVRTDYIQDTSSFAFAGRKYLTGIFCDIIKRKDGSLLHTEVAPFIITLSGRKYLAAIFRDITERQQAEEKIKQASEQWQTTFDSITDWIFIVDKNYKLVRVNRSFSDAIGRSPEDIIGKTCYKLIHKTSEPIPTCPLLKIIQTRAPVTIEYFETGLGIYLDMTSSPMLNDEGDITGIVHIARDVTERKRMQGQLMLTDRLASVGELASGIAHEINNPLTSIITFSQLLMKKDVAEDIKEDLNLVNKEARRTASIVKNLLTFARKHPPMKQSTRIHNVIEEVLKLRAYDQQLHNIEICRQFAPELPEVMVDYFQMQQVFFNIIINAEYFMTQAHNRGTLTITTERLDNVIRISFTDDGPGIQKENLARLFTPFFTTKEVGKGTGLGLSICHGIVSEHNGLTYVRSEPDNGATFIIELPVDGSLIC